MWLGWKTDDVWAGILVVVFGALLVIAALTRTEFVVYRLLVARGRLLWKGGVHKFHVVAGTMCIIAGILIIAVG